MLMLVHPPSGGNGTAASARRRRRGPAPIFSLSPVETQHFRAALRNVGRAYGSLGCLAAAMSVPATTLYQALSRRSPPSVALAFRVARAAGMHVEVLLSGKLSAVGRCEHCGARVGDRPALSVGGAS